MTHTSIPTPQARQKHLVITELEGETIIYDTIANSLHSLNNTAAYIWRQCDGQTTVAEIIRRFNQTYPSEHAEDMVWTTLDTLAQQKLLEANLVAPIAVAGLSRRELLQKVAIGSMFALPLIRSMVAPTAAHAQSVRTTTPAPTSTRPGPFVQPNR